MVYLDNNATTRVAPEVLAEMLPHFSELYHNASSISGEVLGVKGALARSRRAVAHLVGASNPCCLVFTSGATESNNWVASMMDELSSKPGHLVTSAIEHPSVAEPLRRLEQRGWRRTVVPVDQDGLIRQDALGVALCAETKLVSIMAANNETGVVQPIAELAGLVKSKAPLALFHTDATQMAGKLPISFDDDWANVDLLSLSAHKFHGPKGIGALLLREEMDAPPLLLGGGQEEGRRSGTSNVPAIAGLGAAADLLRGPLESDARSMSSLRDRFEPELAHRFPDVVIHGQGAPRLPNTSCFSLPGCDANHLAELLARDGICVGTGSACSAGALHPPLTLLAMGVDHALAAAALRVSLSRYSTEKDLDSLLDRLATLRLSPWVTSVNAAAAHH